MAAAKAAESSSLENILPISAGEEKKILLCEVCKKKKRMTIRNITILLISSASFIFLCKKSLSSFYTVIIRCFPQEANYEKGQIPNNFYCPLSPLILMYLQGTIIIYFKINVCMSCFSIFIKGTFNLDFRVKSVRKGVCVCGGGGLAPMW